MKTTKYIICVLSIAIVIEAAFAMIEETFFEEENLEKFSNNKILNRRKRVIGGSSLTSDSDFPWMVSIQGKKSGWWFVTTSRVYCGGSIINDRWVLTAAHCFDSVKSPGKWHVRLATRKLRPGISDLIGHVIGKITGKKKWQEFTRHVSKIIIHPQYNPNSMWANDIALMKMKKSVPAGEEFSQIRSVSLPKNSSTAWPKKDAECIMTGFGCTRAKGTVSETSMKVVLPKVSDYQCRRLWGIPAVKRFCAGHSSFFSKGICPGDSGGPLVCQGDNDQWIQAGIASFTSRDNPESYPGAFTRVSAYLDWIKKTIATN